MATRNDHGALFDVFPSRPESVHGGAQYDTDFGERGEDPHGPLEDEGYRGNRGPVNGSNRSAVQDPEGRGTKLEGRMYCPTCDGHTSNRQFKYCPICSTRLINEAELAQKATALPSDLLKSHSRFARPTVRKDFGAAGDAEPGGQTVTVPPTTSTKEAEQRHFACPACGHEFAAAIPVDMRKTRVSRLRTRCPQCAHSQCMCSGEKADAGGPLDVLKTTMSERVASQNAVWKIDDGSPLDALKAGLFSTYGIGAPVVAKEVSVAESAIQAEEGAAVFAGAKGAGSVYCPECRERKALSDEGRCPDCNMVLDSHDYPRTRREKGDGNGSAEDSTVKLAADDDGSALWVLKRMNGRHGIDGDVAKLHEVADEPVRDDGSVHALLVASARRHYGIR